MSNQIIKADSGDRVQQWLHLDDFSPGIWDGSYISSANPTISAPLGAAAPGQTFCCASLPQGGLGPLPGIDYINAYEEPFPGTTTSLYVVGFALNPGLQSGAEELIIVLEGDDGTSHYVQAWSTEPATADINSILSTTNPSTPGFFGAPYPAWTRMSTQPVIGDPGYVVPSPVLIFPSAVLTDGHGDQGHLYAYPPVTDPTSYSVQDLIDPTTSGVTGQVVTYNSRVQVLSGVGYAWPIPGGISTNENINYTDPFGSDAYGNQQVILAAEQPWGYGAWGSVSVGELILIKKSGGGVVMNGDISAPNSVIPLPGIESTGDFVGKADASSIGLVYCSQNRGAWLWNGGNTSQKISSQIQDNFYDASSTVIQSNNYGFCASHWQDWVLFSNNWLFDPDTGAWWILWPTTNNGNSKVIGYTFWWWQQGRLGYQVYAAPLKLGVTGDFSTNWYARFNSETAAGHYSWTSLPMHVVPNATRVVDVTQVIVRCSSPDGTGGTVTANIGDWSATTDGVIGSNPTTFRFNAGNGCLGLSDITLNLTSETATDGSAPIIDSVDIGFSTRARQGSDN